MKKDLIAALIRSMNTAEAQAELHGRKLAEQLIDETRDFRLLAQLRADAIHHDETDEESENAYMPDAYMPESDESYDGLYYAVLAGFRKYVIEIFDLVADSEQVEAE